MLKLTTILALAFSLVSTSAIGAEINMAGLDKGAIQCSDYANQTLAKSQPSSSRQNTSEDEKKSLIVNQTI